MNSRFRMAFACMVPLSLTALSACDNPDAVAPLETGKELPDPAQAQASVQEAQAARIAALNNRDVDGAVSVYAPTATLVVPNAQPLTDPASIRATYASLLGDETSRLTVTPTQTWVSAGADFAVTTARMTVVPQSRQPVTMESTSQSVWQRQPDGKWKIVSEYNVALPEKQAKDADLETAGRTTAVPDTVKPDDSVARATADY